MNLRDLARDKTLGLRDALAAVDRKREDAQGKKQAEQERIKRLFSEIASYRKSEQDLKRKLSASEEEIARIRSEIDELERRRSELFEKYTALTDSQRQVASGAKELQQRERVLNDGVRAAQDHLRDHEHEAARLEEERKTHSVAMLRALAEAFSDYCNNTRQQLDGAVLGRVKHSERIQRQRQFAEERGSNLELGQLCDERDELRVMLETSRVPGVRDLLINRLSAIEEKVEGLFPGALATDSADPGEGCSVELFYIRPDEGEFVLLLPFDERLWKEMEAGGSSQSATTAAAVLFGVVKALGLGPSHGEFCVRSGRIAFAGYLDDTEVGVLASTQLALPNLPNVYLSLSRMPAEIEEALEVDVYRS